MPTPALLLVFLLACRARAWTGEIHGRVVCDVCGDGFVGPEDHGLGGAEVAVLCITKSQDVVNFQAYTDRDGAYSVAETMPESERWDLCLVRPISSLHGHCTKRVGAHAGIKFTYHYPSGHSHAVRPILYKPASAPAYC